ncbi:GAF domain-containing protein [Halobaculum sp. WSA2]|uniref:histidine kinase n=1 Tax=Halobaculum saliterrae TaxID=2073113 RepID=A0A6B0SV93_9EURY|nr:GAF domain-containing sensor histidine kinase [Halobaculum saliterrae]MXR40533.1 GAF domain-containing protein [Halobaculum saliterrae]
MVSSPSADLLITALDVFPAEAAVLASDGTILYTNDQWRAFGLENGLVGEDAAMIDENYLSVTTGADEAPAQEAADGVEKVLANEQAQFTLEYPCHSPSERRWFLMTVQGFEYQGNRFAVMGHLNITSRKLAELEVHQQNTYLEGLHRAVKDLLQTDSQEEAAELAIQYLDRILDFPIVGLWLYDDARNALTPAAASEQSDALLGTIPTYQEGEGLSWEVFTTKESRVIDDLTDVPERYNPETPLRSELVLPLGEYGVLNIAATEPNSFDETDVTLAEIWAGTVTQVLARVDREAQLRERERELTRERDRLEEFAGLVSHDLRNPLNIATGHLELAGEDCESDHLETAARALTRMERLIEDMLVLSRQGEVVGSRDAIHLPSLVEDCWAAVETGAASLTVTTDGTVVADESRLQQVFENLFRNAIEHGGPSVSITVGDLANGSGFFVADDGDGIPDAEREDVFQAGYSTTAEGTGFGLKIVHDIVTGHGWEMSITDSTEGGARFEITDVEFLEM